MCACVRERKRECVCVCERERGGGGVYVRTEEIVCVREIERESPVCVRERVCVHTHARARE